MLYLWIICRQFMLWMCKLLLWYILQISSWEKKGSNHKKEQIVPYVPIDIKCSLHPKNPISLFCLEEKGN